MPLYQNAQEIIEVDSSVTTLLDAQPGCFYIIDTSAAAVTVVLPAGIAIGDVITVQNFPAGGFQVGGTVAGNNLVIDTTSPELFDDGSSSQTLGPPTSAITAAARTYYPTGPGSQAGFNGWVH
jgi:hypothetical protein